MKLYREVPPSLSLSQWLECGWFLDTSLAIAAHRVPPDGCLDILYERRSGLRVIGAMTREQRFPLPAGACFAGVRFRPGMAAPFIGVSPAELTDRSAPLEDLWPHQARELRQRMDDAKSIRDAMRVLLSSLRRPAGVPNSVQQAIQAVAASRGTAALDRIARAANLSLRQFRRRCLDESGLPPKLLSRILRFRHACRLARAVDQPKWSAISLEAGYYDQAHLIRDFHALTRLTPMAAFSNTQANPNR